jgi:hypothetical protein
MIKITENCSKFKNISVILPIYINEFDVIGFYPEIIQKEISRHHKELKLQVIERREVDEDVYQKRVLSAIKSSECTFYFGNDSSIRYLKTLCKNNDIPIDDLIRLY